MAEPPADRGTGADTGVEPGPGTPAPTPRWVKVFGVLALVLVLLVVILLLTGGGPGGHGPGRHAPSGEAGEQTSPASATESRGVGGHQPPAGGHAR